MDSICQGPGYLTLDASSLSVGLPEGLMGNSEVGHLNIGAGRVIYQDIVRINMAVKNKTLLQNEAFVNACNNAKNGTGRLHLLGLVSDGGVHSHMDHMLGMVELCKQMGVPKCFLQFFGDGRDTKPTSATGYLKTVLDTFAKMQYGSVATITGRYYAMDRDKRDERIQLAYEGMVQGIGEQTDKDSVIALIESRYNKTGDERQTDEFLKPIIVDKDGLIKDGDTLIFFDYRADRMRQIVEAFGIKRGFETAVVAKNLNITGMTQYKAEFPFPCLFPPVSNKNVLAEWLSKHSVPQYHCAETEKYAHVTFFFNGGLEKQWDMEDRCMVPSPKVPTYDHKPEMNAAGVADEMVNTIAAGDHPFVMCNFAPPDMVGHTGSYEATVPACEATDKAIGRIKEACEKHNYVMMVTSDHGNAEQMISTTGGPHTAHTNNRVPFTVSQGLAFKKPSHNPALCDVATTVLQALGLPAPTEMSGEQLLHL